MPRFAATLLIVYSLTIASISTPAYAQPRLKKAEHAESEVTHKASTDPPGNKIFEARPPKKTIDLKRVFDDETKRFNADTAKFDPAKIEREKSKQAQNNKWTTKHTVFMVVFAVAVAAIVWFVLKYGKECIETNYPNCTPAVDENCYCERYAEDKKK